MKRTVSQGSNFISIENKENQSMFWIEIVGFNALIERTNENNELDF